MRETGRIVNKEKQAVCNIPCHAILIPIRIELLSPAVYPDVGLGVDTIGKIMNKLSLLFSFLLVITLVSGCSSPPTVSPSPTATLIPVQAATAIPLSSATPSADDLLATRLNSALNDLAQKGNLSGAILVARAGQVLFSQGYGMANIDLKISNTPTIKFHIGSLTKQFTAFAILLLQQQGKLNVQDPICKYVKECPETWQAITIHQLLIHTSGIPEFNTTPGIQEFVMHPETPLQIIAQFRNLPLDFKPGEKYAFSNSGYMLLGYIIEKLSGQPYASFLQENIFDPLQMKASGYDGDQQTGPDHALGYKNAATPANFVDKSIGYAASGLYSTVGDLLLWDQSLYTEKLMPGSLRDEIFKAFVLLPASDASSGYGWFIGKQFSQPWMFATSAGAGYICEINRFPESKVTIIILTNRQDTDLKGLNALIAPIIFGGVWVSPTH
jgi:CubicO group peptidase (beta-lactamase class C family)